VTQPSVEICVYDARSEKDPRLARIIAMTAGMAAAKLDHAIPCPFGEDEPTLVDGYEFGLDVGQKAKLQRQQAIARATPPRRALYAALSLPKED
jgi:hypothetical protein